MKRCLNCMEEYEDHLRICPWCGGGGGGKDLPFALKAGSILQGRYIVGTCCGARDCDIRYIGWDALFERKVYIEEFYPARLADRTEDGRVCPAAGREEEYRENLERFQAFRKRLVRLYKERDIEELYSCFPENGTAYATFRYSEEKTLKTYVEEGGGDESEAIAFLYMGLEALKKVHSLGLTHGGVDLENFRITEEGKLVLCGFAEPCHWCGDPGMTDYGNPGEKTDLQGLAMMFGRLLLRRCDAKAAEVARYLDSGEHHLPVRTVLAVKNSITKDEKKRIATLENFYDRVFGDSVTMKLAANGEKGSRRETPKRRNRIPYFAGAAGGMAAVLLLAVFLVSGPLGDLLSAGGGESSSVTEGSVEGAADPSGPEESGGESGDEGGSGSSGEDMTDLNVQESEAEEQTEESAGEGEEEPSEREPAETTGKRQTEAEVRQTRETASRTQSPETTKARQTTAPVIRPQPSETSSAAARPSETAAPETSAAGGQQGSEAETSGGAGNSGPTESSGTAETSGAAGTSGSTGTSGPSGGTETTAKGSGTDTEDGPEGKSDDRNGGNTSGGGQNGNSAGTEIEPVGPAGNMSEAAESP